MRATCTWALSLAALLAWAAYAPGGVGAPGLSDRSDRSDKSDRSAATGAFEWAEDFAKVADGELPAAAWRTTGFTWEVRDGRLVCEDPDKTFAVPASLPQGRSVVVEATLAAQKAVGKEWKIAGICLYGDGRNYWHLAMTESPTTGEKPPRRAWELVECLGGSWLANYEGDTALPAWGTGADGTWEYGRAYRLRLELSGEGIRGRVSDEAGKLIYERAFRFPAGKRAVTAGRPALDCGALRATFDDLKARVADVAAGPAGEGRRTFQPYDRPSGSDILGKATGFFHVEQLGGIWWLIDPKGAAFYGVGTDHCRYEGHWCEKLGYAPYGRNMRARFPNEADWCTETVGRLRSWGFNTLAAGHSESLRHRGLVHTEFISFGARFSAYSDITPKVHWTGFPNVFHPRWEAYCRKVAEEACAPHAGDPWLLGYFLDNELEWYGKSYRPYGLVEEAWAKPADHAAKQALVAMLKERHRTVAAFNTAWGAALADFAALAASREMPASDAPAAVADREAFLSLVADRYFGACCRAIRQADPNHMILGSRFAGGAPKAVWQAAGRHLDVVSVNQYERLDLAAGTATKARAALEGFHRLCGRPMMLTEWSFPALDSNLPCTQGAGMRVDSQSQRAECFGIYQTMLFSLPFMVGSHFFMWVDEPALGISSTFPENTNYGLVDEKGQPYAELTAMAARVNPQAAQYHSGRTADIAVTVDASARHAVLRNVGGLDANVPVEIWEDGVRREAIIPVPPGKAATVPLLKGAAREAHFVAVRADPGRTLPQADRSDDTAFAHVSGHGITADKAVAMIAVANATARKLDHVVVRVPVAELVSPAQGEGVLLSPVGGDDIGPPQQLNVADRRREVVFRVDGLPPFASANFHVTPQTRFQDVAAEALSPPFEVTTALAGLKLRKTEADGDLVDDVVLDGISLGSVRAMVHQNVGQQLWLSAKRLVSVKRAVGPVETTLDFFVEFRPDGAGDVKTAVDDTGKPAAALRRGGAWRGHWRLRIATGRAACELRCLSVTNTDERPWRMESYFHYLPSHIGGSPDGDEAGVGAVPNYYGLRTIWYDAKAAAGFGAVVPEAMEGNFWINPAGGQHPDIRRAVGRELEPGETWTAPADEPSVWVFGVRGLAAQRPWRAISEDLESRARVSVKVWR